MPEAGRSDYDALVQFKQLAPDEPYFLVRAKDAVSGPTARAWAALACAAGAPPAIIEQALRHADLLDAYAFKKVPDDDHLDQAEAANLSYALSRRAWNAHVAGAPPTLGEPLAERRGFDAAGGIERGLQSAAIQMLDALQVMVRAAAQRRPPTGLELAGIERAIGAGAAAVGRAKSVELAGE